MNTISQTRTMYNLSVQEAHTFFVGEQGWLVHNCEPRFASNDLVYGPSARGKLRELQQKGGGKLLSDLGNPYDAGFSTWIDFSKNVMRQAVKNGNTIHFDLTHMDDLPRVLSVVAFPNATTSQELRYIHDNWNTFKGNVKFYRDSKEVKAPW